MNANTQELSSIIEQAITGPNRFNHDRKHDEGRRPEATLAFYAIQPGQRVADLNAGRGYYAGLFADVVGDAGQVYAHAMEATLKRWKGNPMDKRIEEFGISNIEAVLGELEEPNLPDNLDAAFMTMTYHDSVWVGTDRPAMNKAIFDSLKPGGVFGVIDHHTKSGKGTSECQTLHRIEKSVVIDEITAAGFELESESDVLENPDDPLTAMVHDKSISGHTSRFMLKFRKPT